MSSVARPLMLGRTSTLVGDGDSHRGKCEETDHAERHRPAGPWRDVTQEWRFSSGERGSRPCRQVMTGFSRVANCRLHGHHLLSPTACPKQPVVYSQSQAMSRLAFQHTLQFPAGRSPWSPPRSRSVSSSAPAPLDVRCRRVAGYTDGRSARASSDDSSRTLMKLQVRSACRYPMFVYISTAR
jgi:hypothetical protein